MCIHIHIRTCTCMHICICTCAHTLMNTLMLRNLAVPLGFYSLLVSLWNDLVDPVLDGVGLAGFKTRANALLLT